jgi:hypothetical protein
VRSSYEWVLGELLPDLILCSGASSWLPEDSAVYQSSAGVADPRRMKASFGLTLQGAEKSQDRTDAPQGLKPYVFSIIYGTTKVVP